MRSSRGQRRLQPCARGQPRPWDPNCHHLRRRRRHPRSLQARPPGRAASGLLTRARAFRIRERASPPSPFSREQRRRERAEAVPSRLPLRLRLASPSPGRRLPGVPGPPSTPGTAPTRTRVPSLTLSASASPNHSPSPPHLRRLRQRWTQETPGSSTPALLDPLLRLTPLVFSTKWRPRSRAHVAAFPLPVPISPFAARFGGGMALAPSQWPRAGRNGRPIADGYPRI